jgi:hypothetical protein
MARLEVADRGDGLQMLRESRYAQDKKSGIAHRRRSSSLE